MLAPREQLEASGDSFISHYLREGSATGIQWVGVRGAAKHPTMHWTAPTTKNYPARSSAVLRLRNPEVKHGLGSQADLGLNPVSATY